MNTAKSRDEGLRRLLCRRENPERFDWEDRRIAEIKMIVQRRYSGAIPQTDDADIYFRAMARTFAATYAVPADQKSALAEWISAVAPWADAAAVADGLTIDDPHHPQPRHFRSRKLAEVLRVTYEERTTFGLTTISACDKTIEEMKALKIQRAADRKREKRAAGGSRPRAASYSATKPWIDAGFNNRRSWELARKRARESIVGDDRFANSAPHLETGFANSAPHRFPAETGGAEFAKTDGFANSSTPKNLLEGFYVSDSGNRGAEFALEAPWLDLVDKERAARQAAALSYLQGLTNLIPSDAARISRLLADRFQLAHGTAVKLFWQAQKAGRDAA